MHVLYRAMSGPIPLSIYQRFRGVSTLVPPEPGNRFRFRFVFVSCVRASGRGEAAWAREGCASSTLGFRVRNSTAPVRHVFVFFCWYAYGFYAIFAQKCSLGARKLVFFCVGFKGF